MKRTRYLIAALAGMISSATLAQTPTELKSWLPNLDGWQIKEDIEVFNPDNLFDRINGSAPLFIENNFREMTSLEYIRGEEYITIQAYRHASPEDAFGMYASERSPDLTYYRIGGEAQGDDSNLYFFAGNLYVKMWSGSAESRNKELQTIATELAAKIDPKSGYPLVIKALPLKDKEAYSEAYITSNYIGHQFLQKVYVATYNREGLRFQAFIVDGGSKEGAKEVLNNYFKFTKQTLDFAEGLLTIADRYNGDIPALWQGRYIIGLFNENGDAIPNAEAFLQEIGIKLN